MAEASIRFTECFFNFLEMLRSTYNTQEVCVEVSPSSSRDFDFGEVRHRSIKAVFVNDLMQRGANGLLHMYINY